MIFSSGSISYTGTRWEYRSKNSMATSLKERWVSRCRLMRDSASCGLSYAWREEEGQQDQRRQGVRSRLNSLLDPACPTQAHLLAAKTGTHALVRPCPPLNLAPAQ